MREDIMDLSLRGDAVMLYGEYYEVPSLDQFEAWTHDSVCEAPDGCVVEPDGTCPHGQQSWLRLAELC